GEGVEQHGAPTAGIQETSTARECLVEECCVAVFACRPGQHRQGGATTLRNGREMNRVLYPRDSGRYPVNLTLLVQRAAVTRRSSGRTVPKDTPRVIRACPSSTSVSRSIWPSAAR